jgi:HK97 family phage prohead protease
VERGDVDKMSFGFRIASGGERITEDEDGTLRAHVTKIERLYEVSGVNFPAYTGTSLEAVDAADTDELSEGERGYDPETLRSITTMERYS